MHPGTFAGTQGERLLKRETVSLISSPSNNVLQYIPASENDSSPSDNDWHIELLDGEMISLVFSCDSSPAAPDPNSSALLSISGNFYAHAIGLETPFVYHPENGV